MISQAAANSMSILRNLIGQSYVVGEAGGSWCPGSQGSAMSSAQNVS